MACRKCRKRKPAPAATRPLWSDPFTVMATSAFRFTSVDIDQADVVRLVGADATRIAIGFVGRSVLAFSTSLWPDGADADHAFELSDDFDVPWFYLFKHGPMVNLGWSCNPIGLGTVGVYEIYALEAR